MKLEGPLALELDGPLALEKKGPLHVPKLKVSEVNVSLVAS